MVLYMPPVLTSTTCSRMNPCESGFKECIQQHSKRQKLLAVEEFIAELFPFSHYIYCCDSFLLWCDEVVLSLEDVQQGDPLGPPLFCLTIHKLSNKLCSEYVTFYLHSDKVGGSCEDVVKDLLMIEEEAGYLGLKLNQNKSELICPDPTTRRTVLSAFPGLQVVDTDDATLLESPLGGHKCVSKHISEKVNV